MRRTRILRILATTLLIGVAGVIGWHYLLQRPCTRIELTGVTYTAPEVLYSLIDTTLTIQLVVDRIQRHPWVRGGHAVCYPTGTMRVQVLERVPRLLALDGNGSPAYYLDEFGYMIPVDSKTIFDVPLLRGTMNPYHALFPLNDPSVRNLLSILPRLPSGLDSLISEFEIKEDELVLILRGTGADQTTIARFGSEDWEHRFHLLEVFRDQTTWSHGDRTIEMIDLRYQGQIITQEQPI